MAPHPAQTPRGGSIGEAAAAAREEVSSGEAAVAAGEEAGMGEATARLERGGGGG